MISNDEKTDEIEVYCAHQVALAFTQIEHRTWLENNWSSGLPTTNDRMTDFMDTYTIAYKDMTARIEAEDLYYKPPVIPEEIDPACPGTDGES